MDEQELTEREDEAIKRALENPKHLVEYCDDCVKESMKATEDVRAIMDKCWEARNSKMNFKNKESWQSKATTNEPFTTVQQAKAIVRKALLRDDAINVTGVEVGDEDFSAIIKKAFDFWLNPNHANFATYFADASDVALAVGQSMEIIPTWDKYYGLTLPLAEPWKIHRDPDSLSRDPFSGMYWIHEEWMDLWKLKQAGDYENLDNVTLTNKDEEQIKAEERRQMYVDRGKYRKFVRTREFWGVVLDEKGEMLLPSATFTVGGNQIIRPPRRNPYIKAQWPGISFSPLPNPLRFEGHGLLEGVIGLWWLMVNLMNLDVDQMNWVVNQMAAVDPSRLMDPSDYGVEPGKLFVTLSGQLENFFKELPVNAHTADILARLQHWRQMYENGCMVNQFVAGLPGQRSNITKGEVEIKTQQSMGVFDSIGLDIEFGAVNALWLIYEVLMSNWTEMSEPSITRVFGKDDPLAIKFAMMPVEQRKEMLKSNCDITVSGVSTELQQAGLLEKLNVLVNMANNPMYAQYIKPYELLTHITGIYGMHKPTFILEDEEVKQLNMLKATEAFQTLPPENQLIVMDAVKGILPQIQEFIGGQMQ